MVILRSVVGGGDGVFRRKPGDGADDEAAVGQRGVGRSRGEAIANGAAEDRRSGGQWRVRSEGVMFGEESGATVGCRREGSVVDDRMVRRYDGHVGEAKETPADGAHGGSEKETGRGFPREPGLNQR